MVGLVIVSHSRALATALMDLVRQVTNTDIPMAAAAGIGPEREEFGTDAVEIMEAIQSVYTEEGVLVLMDLGSAILSAEMAMEFLPPEMTEKIRFCAAPIVEGAVAAGVQIGLGMDLETVCEEAKTALLPKIEHISGETGGIAGVVISEAPLARPESEIILTLKNEHGLHARPAARFIQTAGRFDAQIQVRNLTTGKGPVSARSLNALATLGALRDHQIAVSASGERSDQALEALEELVLDNFGEGPEEQALETPRAQPAPQVEQVEGAFQAVPISDGLALGPLFRYQSPPPPVPQEPTEDPGAEWQRLEQAISITGTVIRQRRNDLAASVGEAEAEIFDAHLLILLDPDLLSQVRAGIFEEQQNAAAAWDAQIKNIAASYQTMDDPYIQQRAADVLDVGRQVLFALSDDVEMPVIEFEEPVILYAQELTPTQTSQLDMSKVMGIITAGGGPTSHSAILARALGIPAISGVKTTFERQEDGVLIALDGFSGTLWVEPTEGVQAEVRAHRGEWLAQRERLQKTSHEPAATRDGVRIEVVANVGNVIDARTGLRNGAEGVGLLRTEFLFLTRQTPPKEVEQMEALTQIGEAMSGDGNFERPIIVRTLDVGGDKALPYLPITGEANPFLGVRAIRLSLRKPELFMDQLRGILRAGEKYAFKIMFPMVANLSEVQEARTLLEEAHQSLEAEGLAHRWPIDTGIMIEVPAAALLAGALAAEVDFFSIGTNDLTQYTLAAERGNPELAELADALHPAVLRLVYEVAEAAHQHGKWVGVCGELAGDPLAVPLLVGLGVDELSMNPGAIPRTKAILRAIYMPEAQALAHEALGSHSAPDVRRLAREFFERLEGDFS